MSIRKVLCLLVLGCAAQIESPDLAAVEHALQVNRAGLRQLTVGLTPSQVAPHMAPASVRLPWGDPFGVPCLDSPLSVRSFTDPYGRGVRVDLYAVEATFKHCTGASIQTEPVVFREGLFIGRGWPFARQEFGRLLMHDRRWLAFFDHCDFGKSMHAFVSVQGPSSRACLTSQ